MCSIWTHVSCQLQYMDDVVFAVFGTAQALTGFVRQAMQIIDSGRAFTFRGFILIIVRGKPKHFLSWLQSQGCQTLSP